MVSFRDWVRDMVRLRVRDSVRVRLSIRDRVTVRHVETVKL